MVWGAWLNTACLTLLGRQRGDARPGQAGLGRLSRGGPGAHAHPAASWRSSPACGCGGSSGGAPDRPGGAALRAGRASRGPGLSCQPPTLLKRVDPFLPSGRTSRRICYFKTFHSIEPLKKKKKVVGLSTVHSEGGSTFSLDPNLAAQWLQCCSSPETQRRVRTQRVGSRHVSFLRGLLFFLFFSVLYQVNVTALL